MGFAPQEFVRLSFSRVPLTSGIYKGCVPLVRTKDFIMCPSEKVNGRAPRLLMESKNFGRMLWLVLALLCPLFPALRASADAPKGPSFKGMELYSFLSPEGQSRYALLLGTNRNKSLQEVSAAGTDLEGLLRDLARCAPGETILWTALPTPATGKGIRPSPLDAPTLDRIQQTCRQHQFQWVGPQIASASPVPEGIAWALLDRSTGKWSRLHPDLTARRLAPCSTFKIYNTLIGLELGLIRGPDDPWYRWDGVRREFPDWNKDLTLREAIRASSVPAFQSLARRIGIRRMRHYIDRLPYGSRDLSSGVDLFWLPGKGRTSITISADEQVSLLNKLFDHQLPFSERNIGILREVLRVSETPQGVLYGKTGTGLGADGRPDLGWFVGFLERGGKTYLFACNLTGPGNPTGLTARRYVEDLFRSRGWL